MATYQFNCTVCSKNYTRDKPTSKYCNNECKKVGMSLNPPVGAFKKGHKPLGRSLPGHTTSEETKRKIGAAHIRKEVSYHSLHSWIRRNFGKALKCEHCGVVGKKSKGKWTIQWASKERRYTRLRSDWLGLCSACHREYDIKKRGSISYQKKLTGWRVALTHRLVTYYYPYLFSTKEEAEIGRQELVDSVMGGAPQENAPWHTWSRKRVSP